MCCSVHQLHNNLYQICLNLNENFQDDLNNSQLLECNPQPIMLYQVYQQTFHISHEQYIEVFLMLLHLNTHSQVYLYILNKECLHTVERDFLFNSKYHILEHYLNMEQKEHLNELIQYKEIQLFFHHISH